MQNARHWSPWWWYRHFWPLGQPTGSLSRWYQTRPFLRSNASWPVHSHHNIEFSTIKKDMMSHDLKMTLCATTNHGHSIGGPRCHFKPRQNRNQLRFSMRLKKSFQPAIKGSPLWLSTHIPCPITPYLLCRWLKGCVQTNLLAKKITPAMAWVRWCHLLNKPNPFFFRKFDQLLKSSRI